MQMDKSIRLHVLFLHTFCLTDHILGMLGSDSDVPFLYYTVNINLNVKEKNCPEIRIYAGYNHEYPLAHVLLSKA